ncbi:hypothetical protein PENSPDRAFT_655234 [Peniophora sp. CONT]|nr:hypothetical protein PENSPDRAFT_655234 [Peniophora sp. CONT]
MPSAAPPAYPPTARTHGFSDLTTTQPTKTSTMSPRAPPPQKSEQSAERLRGGCLPCPVRICDLQGVE